MKKRHIIILLVLFLASPVFGQSENDFDISLNPQGNVTITGYRGTAKQVVIPSTIEGVKVTDIRSDVFRRKQLTSVTIPNTITIIATDTFRENQINSVTIPNSITIIGDRAFMYNQLTSVTIPDSVTSIGISAFQNNQLTSVTIPKSVTSVGKSAFHNNQLTSITIPTNVSYAGEFPNNFKAYYDSQGRKGGTYTWSGRLWSVK